MSRQPPAIPEALEFFDRARRLRTRLPLHSVPDFRYSLAACWLNRAEALMMAEPPQVQPAIDAFDEAIALLADLPLDSDRRFRRRLAIAHQNRGLALAARSPASATAVSSAFEHALAALGTPDRTEPDDRYLLGAILVNLASAEAGRRTDSHLSAREHARRAMAVVAGETGEQVRAAEVDLKARHVLCRLAAERLSGTPAVLDIVGDDLHETTDLVDDGLRLVRDWERRGDHRFRGLARDLVRFGARVYARFQPQFVNEFLAEHGDMSE
jgi:hypothetical protein